MKHVTAGDGNDLLSGEFFCFVLDVIHDNNPGLITQKGTIPHNNGSHKVCERLETLVERGTRLRINFL